MNIKSISFLILGLFVTGCVGTRSADDIVLKNEYSDLAAEPSSDCKKSKILLDEFGGVAKALSKKDYQDYLIYQCVVLKHYDMPTSETDAIVVMTDAEYDIHYRKILNYCVTASFFKMSDEENAKNVAKMKEMSEYMNAGIAKCNDD